MWTQVVFLLLSGLFSGGNTATKLPCRLEWTSMSSGNSLPVAAVTSHGSGNLETEQYVARGLSEFGDYFVGRYDPLEDRTYIAYENENGTATALTDFEVLTNPFGCRTVWTLSDPSLRIPVTNQLTVVIGRGQPDDYNWYSGEINMYGDGGQKPLIKIPIDDETEIFESSEEIDYQFLISYSNGLKLEVTDFVFAQEMTNGRPDIATIDEIHNESPAIITQSMSHKKVLKEKSVVSFSETYTSSSTDSYNFNVIFYGKKKSETHTYSRTETTTVTTETETNVTFSVDIQVEPYQSIRSCSVVYVVEDFKTDYTAVGYYTAPGMTSSEVAAILAKDNVPDVVVSNDKVSVPMTGQIGASFAMSTTIINVPYDPNDSCVQIQRNAAANRKKVRYVLGEVTE